MITLTFDEAILSNKDLTPVEKLLSAKECQGMSVKKMAKMLGLSERHIFRLRTNTTTTDAKSDDYKTDDFKSDDARSDIKDEILRLFEKNCVNTSNFKGIGSNELFSRIKAYSFNLELDLSNLHVSSGELYDILNNM